MAWEWWKGDAGWQSVTLQVNLEILDLAVSGCPEDRYNGLYRLDLAAPTANEKPHFSNGEDMHLYYGSVNGWYFKDQYTPHESNATAYSMAVMGANTWQWWNKERAEWISYACTIAAKAPTPAPAAAPAAATPAAPAQIVGAPVAAAGASATTVAAAGESWLTAAIPMDNPNCGAAVSEHVFGPGAAEAAIGVRAAVAAMVDELASSTWARVGLAAGKKNAHVVAQKTKLEVAELAGGAAADGSVEPMQVETSADAEERAETKAPPAAAAAAGAGSGSTAGLPLARVGVQERFKLFISGLSRSTTEAALRSHFGGETVILLHPLLPLVGV